MDISLSSQLSPAVSGESVSREEHQETRNQLILTTAVLDLKEREIERLQRTLREKETNEDRLERLGADGLWRREIKELNRKLTEQEAKAAEEWSENVKFRIRMCKLMSVVQKSGKASEYSDGEEMIENHIVELEKTIKNNRSQLKANENEISELNEKLQVSEEKVSTLEEEIKELDKCLLGAQRLQEQMNMLAKEFGLGKTNESHTSGKRARMDTGNQENGNIHLDAFEGPSNELRRRNFRKVKARVALKLRI